MSKRQPDHPIRARYPDGYAALAEKLKDILGQADERGVPIERWTDAQYDRLRQAIRTFFVQTRNGTNVGQFRQKAAADGIIASRAELKAETDQIKGHLRLIEPEAIRAIETLRMRVNDARTRDAILVYLREWRDASRDPNIPPRVLGQTLRDLLSNDYITVPSDGVSRGMLEALERATFDTDAYDWPTAQGVAHSKAGTAMWQYELMPDSAAKARDALLPAPDLDEKVRQAMVTYAKNLGDRESDLMTLLMAKFAERARHPDDKVKIQLNEVMSALGYSKHASGNAGESFTTKDKAVVREQINGLEGGYLTIRKAGREPGKRPVDVESRVLAIWDRTDGQADFDGRIRDWHTFTMSFGRAWSTRLFDPRGRMTALLQAQALAYDAIRERPEKRLLKRLGWYWKLNDHPTTAPRTVATWVRDDVGDDPTAYQRREAERFEQALDRLKADGHITDWKYVGGESRITDTDGAMVRGWRERWLEREVVVEAPEGLRLAYATRRKPVEAPARPALPAAVQDSGGNDFGRQVRAFRARYGITGLAAAEQLGIGNTVLSRIETGKRTATAEQRQRIENWMRDLKNRPDKVRDLHG